MHPHLHPHLTLPPPPRSISDLDDYDPAGFDEQDDIQEMDSFPRTSQMYKLEAGDLGSGTAPHPRCTTNAANIFIDPERSFTPSEQAHWDRVGRSIAYSETDLAFNSTFYDPAISYSELLAYIRSFKTTVEDV